MTGPADRDGERDGERGGILALTLGVLGVAALLIVVVAVASSVYLDRRELLALADTTAAHAATRIDPAAYAEGTIMLTDQGVRTAALDFLASAPSSVTDLPGLALVEPTGASGATTAQVTLTAYSRPAFLPWLLMPWSDGIAMTVTSSAGV